MDFTADEYINRSSGMGADSLPVRAPPVGLSLGWILDWLEMARPLAVAARLRIGGRYRSFEEGSMFLN